MYGNLSLKEKIQIHIKNRKKPTLINLITITIVLIIVLIIIKL
ncbi:hypothetical protein [Paraclostridium bifermentans]